MIAKLKAYGLDITSLNFLLDYLKLGKHRTKVGSSYHKWSEEFEKSEVLLMTIMYIHVEKISLNLKRIWYVLWLNSLKANPGKFQFMILGDKNCYRHILRINSTCVRSSDSITLLRVNLLRVTRVIFCREKLYSKIEKFHHRSLKVVYGIDDSYKNLLLSSNSVSIHQRHLQFLVTEIFKSLSQINPEFIWLFFKPKKVFYKLRKGPVFDLPRTQSPTIAQMLFTYYGTIPSVLRFITVDREL